jgi:polysaccharide deacetylase 2 family uncharacterized protein YibQ
MAQRLVKILLLGMWPALIFAAPSTDASYHDESAEAVISIIIDDLGINHELSERALHLPGEVTYAFLPHSPYGHDLALEAHALKRESILHLPMQAIDDRRIDRGALTRQQSRAEFLATLREDLKRIPYIRGVNNHMGSLLTQMPDQMRWLMEELGRHDDMFFLDSRTTPLTVAYREAVHEGLPSLRRNIFLDNDTDATAINHQFIKLLAIARLKGSAVAIGHPYPETLTYLENMLPALPLLGIRLLPASQLIEHRTLMARQNRPKPLQTAELHTVNPDMDKTSPSSTNLVP